MENSTNIKSVIEAINSINPISSVDVLSAKAQFDTLSAGKQSRVTNADKLNQIYSEYAKLRDSRLFCAYATYLSPKPEYEGQFHSECTRCIYSHKTEDGFYINWRTPEFTDSKNPYVSQTLAGKYALDGLCLSLKNFSYTGKSDFFICFSGGEINNFWDGSLFESQRQIVIKMGADSDSLELHGFKTVDPVCFGSSEILKRQNLVGKDIKIEWHRVNNDYMLFIAVGDKVVSATIPAKRMDKTVGLDRDAVRVIIMSNGYENDFSLECNGIYAPLDSEVAAVTEKIAALPSCVTSDADCRLIEDAFENGYMTLPREKRYLVPNYPLLNNLRTKVRAYRGVDSNGFDADGFYQPTMDDIYENTGNKTTIPKSVATKAAEFGLNYDFTGAGFGQRQYLTKRFVAEDITLRFSNLQYGDGGLIIGLDAEPGGGGIWNLQAGTPRFGFYLLFKDNCVYITRPYLARRMKVLLCEDLLSLDNLVNKDFYVTLHYDIEKWLAKVSITVDGVTFTKSLDRFYCSDMDQFRFNYDGVEVVVQSVAGYDPLYDENYREIKSAFSIDLTGIKYNTFTKREQAKIDAVVDQIAALPDEVSLESEPAITAVWNEYFKLSKPKMRAAVTNFSKLTDLYGKLFEHKYTGNTVKYTAKKVKFEVIDNTNLLPKYVEDEFVTLDSEGVPTWCENIILGECRIRTATKEGTFQAMEPVLKHFASVGVNLLWITPISDRGNDPISEYCNFGPATICPYMTGQIPYGEPYDPKKVDYAAGWKIFDDFLKLAHSYNIRVLIDIVPWGLSNDAPMVKEHPEWFKGKSSWGGMDYDPDNAEVIQWYKDQIEEPMKNTCCDGIRWDLEPCYFGHPLVREILLDLQKVGKKPLFISETSNTRQGAYAFEQANGVIGVGTGAQTYTDVFFKDVDIVNCVKTGSNLSPGTDGAAKYYCFQLTSHDLLKYSRVSLAAWAYEYAFSSFIPLFYLGEEWKTEYGHGVYGSPINWEELNEPEHREYFEHVKKLLQLRWLHSDILATFEDDHRNTNICTVDVLGTDLVKGYARFGENKAIIVVVNVNELDNSAADMTIGIPLNDMGLDKYNKFTVTDLLSDDTVAVGSADEISKIMVNLEHESALVLQIIGE